METTVEHVAAEVTQTALTWPARAEALRVVDDETYANAADMLKGIKALRNTIADTFDKHIATAHAQHKALLKEKATAEAPLTIAESIIKKSLTVYATEQERRRKVEEARLAALAQLEEENRRLVEAAALEAEGLKTGDQEMVQTAQDIMAAPVVAPVITLPKATPTVAGVSMREAWRYRITDPALVPRSYLVIDDAKLGAVVRALKEMTDIPGVVAYSEKVASASGR